VHPPNAGHHHHSKASSSSTNNNNVATVVPVDKKENVSNKQSCSRQKKIVNAIHS
jgi:hypothetical protein